MLELLHSYPNFAPNLRVTHKTIHMKKNLMFMGVAGLLSFNAGAFAPVSGPEMQEVKLSGIWEQIDKKIIKVREELENKGFTATMMDDLFGDENFYFPKTEKELETTVIIVDLIIDNGQYSTADRFQLVNLANAAYDLYQSNLEIVVSAH